MCRYINWTEQHFPVGSGLEVKQLLERCIRQFNEDVKYKNDERFVRIWLKYVSVLVCFQNLGFAVQSFYISMKSLGLKNLTKILDRISWKNLKR